MADGTVLETITLEEAQQVIDAAAKKATEIGQPMDIAVVDAGGNLKAHVRMDGANIGSITIAINKAYTSIAFQCETGGLQEAAQRQGLFAIGLAHDEAGFRHILIGCDQAIIDTREKDGQHGDAQEPAMLPGTGAKPRLDAARVRGRIAPQAFQPAKTAPVRLGQSGIGVVSHGRGHSAAALIRSAPPSPWAMRKGSMRRK